MSWMKFLLLLPIFFAIIPPHVAISKPASPSPSYSLAPPTVAVSTTVPVDVLERKILKERNSDARVIKHAYEAIEYKKYDQALRILKQIKPHSDFADYQAWMQVIANEKKASDLLQKKQYRIAIPHLHRALSTIGEAYQKFSNTPWRKYYTEEIAKIERSLGQGYWGIKDWKQSQKFFNQSFVRLQESNLWRELQSTDIEHYAEVCKKSRHWLCTSWLNNLAIESPKQFKAVAVIKKVLPNFEVSPKVPWKGERNLQKVSVPYKAPDSDQVAFDECMKNQASGDLKGSSKCFKAFISQFPRSVHLYRARYWLGRALWQRGESLEAKKVFEDIYNEGSLTYYGLLSSEYLDPSLLNAPVGTQVDIQPGTQAAAQNEKPFPDAIETDTYLRPQDYFHLMRARFFLAEKMPIFAALELNDVASETERNKISEASTPFLMYLISINSLAKNYRTCFFMLQELSIRKVNLKSPYLMKIMFPTEFINHINFHTKTKDLDPVLILSLIKQESAFSQEALSKAGALGLMQLMPTTALSVDNDLKLTDLKEAETNIRIGTAYFNGLLNQYKGNLAYALAAYNAGPTAVGRWLKNATDQITVDANVQEFIESIPYRETREYVSSILRNYYWYSQLMKKEIPEYFNKLFKNKPLTH